MHRTFVSMALAIAAGAIFVALFAVAWLVPTARDSDRADRAPITTPRGGRPHDAEELILFPDVTLPEVSACPACDTDCEPIHVDPGALPSFVLPDSPKPIPPDPGNRPLSLIKVKPSRPPPSAAEIAIRDAQEWLMHHQRTDGSWSFDHSANNVHAGPVNNPGKLKSTTGATGLAMMALLRTPDMRRHVPRQDEILRGAKHLLKWEEKNVEAKRPAGDLRGEEGDMLCQAWATIALCEAYGATMDNSLKRPAQDAIAYIESVQHADGGWGQSPGEPGECLVSAWNIQALKAGHLVYLEISGKAIRQSITFLDSIQSDGGSRYGSTKPGDRDAACTAAGHLCRMYLGRKRDDPSLIKGVAHLSQGGPATNDVIYNYKASQVMLHWDRRDGKLWRDTLEPQILAAQVRTGRYSGEKGSWFAADERIGGAIGRLGYTALQSITVGRRFEPQPHQWMEDSDEF